MTPGKRLLFAGVTLGASMAIALVASELILRALQLGYGNNPLVSDPMLHHAHPKNYAFRAQTPSNEFGGFPIKYDSQGLSVDPDDPGISDPAKAKYRWAFVGDSFVESTEVPYRESFAGRIAGALRGVAAVKNYGVSSYSPAIYVVEWPYLVKPFHPTHVFMLLYSNDIRDDQGYAKAGKYDANGRLVAVPGPGGGRIVEALRELYTVRLIRKVQLKLQWMAEHRNAPQPQGPPKGGYIEENPDITPLSAGFVREVADSVRRSGAEFVLMAVPSKERMLSPPNTFPGLEFADKWKEWAQRENIRYLNLAAAFREARAKGTCKTYFFDLDIHWNSCGHGVVANAILSAFPEHGKS